MTEHPAKKMVNRYGRAVELDICPSCLGHGSKQIQDGMSPEGRPTQVRDLRGAERHRARRMNLEPSRIWACLTCQGEGYR